MPAPTPKESGISQFITREAGAIPRDVIAVDSLIDIVTSSTADPTVVTTKKTHGYRNGQVVVITGHSGSDDDATMNQADGHAVTVISTTTFSVPVDLSGGAGGGTGGTVAPLVATGIMLVVFAAEDFLPLDSASVAGPDVTNTEQTIQTRGDLDLDLSLAPDSGFDEDGLLQPGDTLPRNREITRITNRLQELLGNRFQRIEVQFVGTPES
ncbi:hypothetical protein LCGC14_2747390 [marine sediment metagenome]|uniref:Uncharacterized protein n=1 Tax=marine sediment metagenome TaxID=412755 RepID=A0A0F8Z2P1_9ZZZZ